MFYRVVDSVGNVMSSKQVVDGKATMVDHTLETAIAAAQRLAQAKPGVKYYVAKAIREVVVELPSATVRELS